MEKKKAYIPFSSADILLPKENHEKWAVIACDQFTSEPEYWETTSNITNGFSSSLDIILPEVYLSENDVDKRISSVNQKMNEYLNRGIFTEYKNAMILVERTLSDGRKRYGIVGAVDLDAYSYEKNSKSMIRATEETVISRIPPRVKIRKDAPLELPHIMILIDDEKNTVIGGIDISKCKTVYDFDLMQGGGHLKGYLIPEEIQEKLLFSLSVLAEEDDSESPMLFAVGDGNHSLATAKACSEFSASPLSEKALVEIVNIHDPALDFEPIYRVMFGVDTDDVRAKLKAFLSGQTEHRIECVTKNGTSELFANGLTSKALQEFIDNYIEKTSGASVDYIHGKESLEKLCKNENTIGFLFDGMKKSELFPYVRQNGALPRKTFSMGEAEDKRYYMEARKIK